MDEFDDIMQREKEKASSTKIYFLKGLPGKICRKQFPHVPESSRSSDVWILPEQKSIDLENFELSEDYASNSEEQVRLGNH